MATQNVEKTSLPIFPFTAIVGQEEMKLALELNVIDPKIGGVIIMGDRGTGKSTTIRAIADLLPEISIFFDSILNFIFFLASSYALFPFILTAEKTGGI